MSKVRDSKVVVKEVFDDVAVLIGSVAAAQKLSDDSVQALIGRLDRVRVRTLRRLSGGEQGKAAPPHLHPAVEEFLFRNGQGLAE